MTFKNFLKYHFSLKLSLGALVLASLMLIAAKWQWDRYLEKEHLVRNLQENVKKESVNILEIDTLNIEPFTKVFLEGSFDHENEHLVINRRHKYGSGSWLMTPFILKDSDKTILVSRGFIPFEDKSKSDLQKYKTEGKRRIYGVSRETVGKRAFLSPSASNHMTSENQWLYPDLSLISKALPYEIESKFFIQQLSDPVYDKFPAEDITIDVPPSTHFWYTFEWIALAIFTCLIAFMIQLFKPKKTTYK